MNIPKVDSLEDVRENIDQIDQKVIQLLGQQQFYVKQTARFKKSDNEVKAPARVEAIIAKVRILAAENNLDADIAEAVYRTMIDGFIKKELKEFQINTIKL